MALVSIGWELAVTCVDNGAQRSTLLYHLRSADYAAAIIDAGNVVAKLGSVMDSIIADYFVKEHFSENALSLPAMGVQNENKASLTCSLAGVGSRKANLKIPGPKDSIFAGTEGGAGNVVDMNDGDVQNYGDLFKSGNECYIARGQDLDTLLSGKRIHAKSNFG